MAIKSATPYLILGGRADEAIPFYERALGLRLESLQRFGDSMHDCPVALEDQVMHAVLQHGGTTIFLADGAPDGVPPPGGTVNVALDFDSEESLRRSFDLLAEGGKVVQAVIQAPWGLFGALQDRFGINWMFSTTSVTARG